MTTDRHSHVGRRDAEDRAAARRIDKALSELTPEEIAEEEAKAERIARKAASLRSQTAPVNGPGEPRGTTWLDHHQD